MALREILAATIALAVCVIGNAGELPKGAVLLAPDILWDLEPDVVLERQEPAFAISPDDEFIAYISKGAIWKCSVIHGPPTKLVDLPNTKTAILATPEYRAAWSKIGQSGNGHDQHIFLGRLPQDLIDVCSLAWTPSQDGIVYALRRRWQSIAETAKHEVLHVSQTGVVTSIAIIRRERFEEPHDFTLFHLTRDRKHVIASTGYTPLIWDTVNNKPRATCFDLLVPSSTSDRFLGIEIDTRQLVVANEDFKISRRFDVTVVPRRACAITWSPDERYAICRIREEHPSNKWDGFRVDLQTGEKRDLEGPHFPERWVFTGDGGEAIRIGKSRDFLGVYADGGGCGTYISILPDGNEEQRDVSRFQRPRESPHEYSRKAGLYPPVRNSRDGGLFTMAFPRDDATPGYRYFLIDREGNKWPLGSDDPSKRVSPYNVVAIVNHGQTIIACDETRLFSIPVEAIRNANLPADK